MIASDPFLHNLIDNLHDTPMQRKLRHLAPMPVGCVFLPWPGMTEDEAREQFSTMRRLGFTCLKQTMATPEWPEARTLNLALDEGILPFWYAEGGYEDITPRPADAPGAAGQHECRRRPGASGGDRPPACPPARTHCPPE